MELSEIEMFEISRTSKKTGGLINDLAKETLVRDVLLFLCIYNSFVTCLLTPKLFCLV